MITSILSEKRAISCREVLASTASHSMRHARRPFPPLCDGTKHSAIAGSCQSFPKKQVKQLMGIGQGLSRPAWKGRLEGPHFHPAVVRIGSPAARLAVVRCGKISEDEMSPSDPGVTQSNQLHAAASYNDLSDVSVRHDTRTAPKDGHPPSKEHGDRLFSFGVIADVQHADIPDGHSFKGIPRYYRGALDVLDRAVDTWADEGVDFCMHLGDIVDGYNPKEESEEAVVSKRRGDLEETVARVVGRFDRLGKPFYSMLGNHCLYNLPRARLHEVLRIPQAPDGGSHYAFSPHPAWRVVVLDAYGISALGWPADDPRTALAERLLEENNPNAREGNPNSPEGLEGPARRFVKFGGGLGEDQRRWLSEQLAEAREEGQRAILTCHLPMHPESCFPTCLLWDYEETLEVIGRFPGVVALTMAGHMHRDGDSFGPGNVHHRCVHGVVETPPGKDCHAIVDVFRDRIDIRGFGEVRSQTVWLQEPAAVEASTLL